MQGAADTHSGRMHLNLRNGLADASVTEPRDNGRRSVGMNVTPAQRHTMATPPPHPHPHPHTPPSHRGHTGHPVRSSLARFRPRCRWSAEELQRIDGVYLLHRLSRGRSAGLRPSRSKRRGQGDPSLPRSHVPCTGRFLYMANAGDSMFSSPMNLSMGKPAP
jgi:hypothetical protein